MVRLLPDVAEELAAHGLATGFLPGHDAFRRGKDGDPETAVDARDLVPLNVDAKAWLGDTLQPGEDWLASPGVAEVDLELALGGAIVFDAVVADEALFLEDLGNRHLRSEERRVGKECECR